MTQRVLHDRDERGNDLGARRVNSFKPHTRIFEQHRNMMYGIAYRMLGSISDAEDIVQDAYFRWSDTRLEQIESPRRWLATAVSRLCIDRQRRKKIEKLCYTGPWLPEPVITEGGGEDPEAGTSLAEEVSIAFLLLLERLTPLERAVFILKETFDFVHEEVADMLGIETAHSRQLFRRARNHLGEIPDSTHRLADPESRAVMQKFMTALMKQDIDGLRELLTDDIVAYSDGGGRVPAALIPLVGFDKVSRVFLHLAKTAALPAESQWRIVNGAWALVYYVEGGIDTVTTAQVEGGKIRRIFVIRNPAKLRHLPSRQTARNRRLTSIYGGPALAPYHEIRGT